MRDKQELSRVQAALEGVLRVKATAEQELQDAQRIASSAASQTAAAQEALEETKAGLCKVGYTGHILKRGSCILLQSNVNTDMVCVPSIRPRAHLVVLSVVIRLCVDPASAVLSAQSDRQPDKSVERTREMG